MKTKVLVVTHDDNSVGFLQEKIDKAVEALGDGWIARSASTHSCTRGYTSYAANGKIYGGDPIIIWTTTIVMKKQ